MAFNIKPHFHCFGFFSHLYLKTMLCEENQETVNECHLVNMNTAYYT